MKSITKKNIDFSSGKAISIISLLPVVLEKYISGDENEIFIRETLTSKHIYSVYVNVIGDRESYLYAVGRASALTVIKIAEKYNINLTNNKNEQIN